MTNQTLAASELAQKALQDNTNYNILELGHAKTDDVMTEIRKCIDKHNPLFDEDEYCIVRQLASDPLLPTLRRCKYYGYLYLPKPRPEQTVFLYNKKLDKIRRLWSLPNGTRMTELATTTNAVPEEYKTMQAWSIAFFDGVQNKDNRFWEFIRYQHGINMPSEHEYFLAHREELIKAGCKIPDSNATDPFDFSKISIEKIVDTEASAV